jgi:hypothetical protein
LPEPMISYPGATYANVEAVETGASIGEESRTFAFTNQLDAATAVAGYVVFTRVGDLVARIEVDSVPEAPLSAVLTLAEAQAACLAAGACETTVAIPDELLAQSARSATPVATPAAPIDPGLTGSGSFSAADGSWHVTWDEGTWTPTSVLRDDGEVLLLSLLSESSAQLQVGTRDGYARFAGDAAKCVQSVPEAAAAVPEIHDVAPMLDADGTPVATHGDDRATGAFQFKETLDDGSEQTFVAYATCITIEPGESVVAALFTVAQDRFAETRPLAEAIIENLTITPGAQ